MTPPRIRFTIGQVMVAVAVSAAAMALVGPRIAPTALAIPLIPWAIFIAARRRWGLRRVRIIAWLLTAYPVAFLAVHYAGRAIARGMPGTLGFPVADLGFATFLLALGGLFAWWACIGFVLAEVVRATRPGATGPSPAPLVVAALATWPLPVLMIWADPGGSFRWLFRWLFD